MTKNEYRKNDRNMLTGLPHLSGSSSSTPSITRRLCTLSSTKRFAGRSGGDFLRRRSTRRLRLRACAKHSPRLCESVGLVRGLRAKTSHFLPRLFRCNTLLTAVQKDAIAIQIYVDSCLAMRSLAVALMRVPTATSVLQGKICKSSSHLRISGIDWFRCLPPLPTSALLNRR